MKVNSKHSKCTDTCEKRKRFYLLGRTLRPQKYKRREEIYLSNRLRNERLEIKLTEEEMQIFKEKMKLSKSRTMAHFIRKCVMEKDIYYVDLEPFRNIQWLLSNFTNNVNQIAKHVNQTGVIYKKDIEKIRSDLDALSVKVWNIYDLLMKRTKE